MLLQYNPFTLIIDAYKSDWIEIQLYVLDQLLSTFVQYLNYFSKLWNIAEASSFLSFT